VNQQRRTVVSNRIVMSVVALIALAACTGPSAVATQAPPSSAASANASPAEPTVIATQAADPTTAPLGTASAFTSPLYGYTITLPAGWAAGAAIFRWDGKSSPSNGDPTIDKFGGPPSASAWAHAAPVAVGLDKFVKDNIAWTVRDHGDTCPATAPEKTEPIEIGGEAGKLLSWDCGILINVALLVRNGTGYVFVMRDVEVQAATDRADRALFEVLLDSVVFPS
jgi:hypothetical protein